MAERDADLLVFGHARYQWNPKPSILQKQVAWRCRIKEFHALSALDSLRLFFDPFVQSP